MTLSGEPRSSPHPASSGRSSHASAAGHAGYTISSIARAEIRSDGVAVLTLDDPAGPHNTITPALAGELSAAFDALERDGKVRAVVLRGKKESFLAGANIDFVRSIRFASDAEEAAREIARRFTRIAAATKPIVAYVHGPALGGGLELALACTATIASDDAKTALGLPEVKLGLMPGANGLLRVAERAGLRTAIDLGLTGRSLRPDEALALGLVDDVVAASIGLDAACALALRLATDAGAKRALVRERRAKHRGSMLQRTVLERNLVGRALLFRRAKRESRAKTRGHYPAPERILDVLARYGARGFASAADLEARSFGDLVVSETAHRMIDLFFAKTSLKKDTGLEAEERATPRSVEHVAVIGAGLMGAGIAAVTIQTGVPVRMKDRSDVAIGRGLRWVQSTLDARVRRGAMTARERDAKFSLLGGATDYSGFRNADLVIEAVFDDLEVKHGVVRDVEKLVSDSCVIASSTASIPIARIAEGAKVPERIVGMHYGWPVHASPLLEVVRTARTDVRAIATAVAFGKRQGKTVIVVRDGAAFYSTRILAPYLNEATHLLAEGTAIELVDRALVDWGFPIGPLHLLDEIGIDLASHVAGIAQAAFGERMRPSDALVRLVADHRRGRKNGRGFYLYRGGPKRERYEDDTVYGAIGAIGRRKPTMIEELSLRCGLALVNEALRCLGDGVLRSPRDGDVGAILGAGFPAFRGGPFRYVDVLGAPEILRRLRSLEQAHGARFEPAPLLVEMARSGKRFYP